jgi:xylulokinase
MTLFLGIDLGTSAVKSLLVDENGEVKASHSVEYPMLTPRPGWAEQHPDDWWNGTVRCVRELMGKSGADPASVAAIGLSGQMHGSVFLDRDGNVIRPALLWCDQRTGAQCEAIDRIVGPSRLGELTGNRALTGFTAPKILWLRDEEPENYARVAHILLPKDYVRLRMTGEWAMDVADASGTLLLNVRERRWSDEMLRLLDIPSEWLPPLYESNEIVGRLRATEAEAMGLVPGIPVAAGGGDQACGAVGVGVTASGIASVALGTSGVVFVHDDAYHTDEAYRLHAFCHGVPGKWHRMGVMLSAGGSFQWWRNHFGYEEKLQAAAQGGDPYEYLTRLAETAPLGSEGLLFLPYLTGERTPHPDPLARGGFIGLNVRHGKAHLTRAVLEGITFGLRDSLTLMRKSGVDVRELRVNGGGARSPFWRQMIADVFRCPVVTVNTTDGPAYGAAVMAASAALGAAIPDLCARWIRPVDRAEPDGAASRIYDEYYAIYRSLYGVLKETNHALSGLAARA